MTENLARLIDKAERLMARIESVLPQPLSAPDWSQSVAWRYRKRASGHGALEPVRHVGAMALSDLKEIEPLVFVRLVMQNRRKPEPTQGPQDGQSRTTLAQP